jgi:hypothetical protein
MTNTKKENEQAFAIHNVSNSLICRTEPKVTFINELWVGKVKVPVKTELDFSGVHESQHEKILELAQQIYYKDRQINGC